MSESPYTGETSVAPVTSEPTRRSFLLSAGAGALGAAALNGNDAQAVEVRGFQPLWGSAEVVVGNSPGEQRPSSVIKCPLFLVLSTDRRNTYLGVRAWSEGDEEEVSSSWVYRSAERGAVGALEEG